MNVKNYLNAKKKSRFFELYISKVLKQVSSDSDITNNAKQQLNSVLCFIIKKICDMVFTLTEISGKRTLSLKELINAINILFHGELSLNAISEGKKAISKYFEDDNDIQVHRRHTKANIIFPVSIMEKFLRNFGNSKIMITETSSIFLASSIEYLCAEILETSSLYAKDNNRSRITIRDLELGIRNDIELNLLFQRLHIEFIGGGVIPFIHPILLKKKKKPKKISASSENTSHSEQILSNNEGCNTNNVVSVVENIKKPHRFKNGTVAIREIRKYQRINNCLTMTKHPFEKLVRDHVNNIKANMKISKEVFIILQYYIEQYIIDILRCANLLSIHAGRLKIQSKDILLVQTIQSNNKNLNNYYINDNILSSIEQEFEIEL